MVGGGIVALGLVAFLTYLIYTKGKK